MDPNDPSIVNDDTTVYGAQYWSLHYQSQRGFVAGPPGVSHGVTGAAVNQLTVTNYSDTSDHGSLVEDLVAQKCTWYPNEGGASYAGYDQYRKLVQQAHAAGVPVIQRNVSNYVARGRDCGPANVWIMMVPAPPSDPIRKLNYTLAFQGNQLLSYETRGIEHVPGKDGRPVLVHVESVETHSNYKVLDSADDWPAGFFSPQHNCVFS